MDLPADPEFVTSHDIRAWIVSMLDNNYSTVSVHRKISCLRVFFRYLRKEGIIKNDPLEKVVLPKRKKTFRFLWKRKPWINCLIIIISEMILQGIRNRTIIEMLYLTGMRRSELIGLRNRMLIWQKVL